MKKTQILGALALAMVLIGASTGCAFAADEETVEVDTVEAQQSEVQSGSDTTVNEAVLTTTAEQGVVQSSNELDVAIKQAEAARDYAKNNASATYPGIDKYIDKLLATAGRDGVDEAKIIESLNDAASLTYKLLSKNQVASNAGAELTSGMKVENTEIPTKVIAGVVDPILLEEAMKNNNANTAQPGVVSPVATEEGTDDDGKEESEQIADNGDEVAGKKEDAKTESTVDIVEHEMGLTEILIAGAVVLVLGAGIAALMIRSRRNA